MGRRKTIVTPVENELSAPGNLENNTPKPAPDNLIQMQEKIIKLEKNQTTHTVELGITKNRVKKAENNHLELLNQINLLGKQDEYTNSSIGSLNADLFATQKAITDLKENINELNSEQLSRYGNLQTNVDHRLGKLEESPLTLKIDQNTFEPIIVGLKDPSIQKMLAKALALICVCYFVSTLFAQQPQPYVSSSSQQSRSKALKLDSRVLDNQDNNANNSAGNISFSGIGDRQEPIEEIQPFSENSEKDLLEKYIVHSGNLNYLLAYHISWQTYGNNKPLDQPQLKVAEKKLVELANEKGWNIFSINSQSNGFDFTVTAPPKVAPILIVQQLKTKLNQFLLKEYKELALASNQGNLWNDAFVISTNVECFEKMKDLTSGETGNESGIKNETLRLNTPLPFKPEKSSSTSGIANIDSSTTTQPE